MATRYLLDTNVLSQLVRNPQGTIAAHIARVGPARICTSIIVACELRYGAIRSGSARLRRQVEAILAAVDVLPFQPDADESYASIRTALERRGVVIGGNDLLIAAHARALHAVCVTGNESEFRRVPGLQVENWLGSARE
jgi:tRNA(fMet)-specific endonuclease VapC